MERTFHGAHAGAQEGMRPAEMPVCLSGCESPAYGGMNIETTTQEMLLHMIGRYVVCELLIALNTFYIREGILLQVAKNFFLLFDESTNTRVACDLNSLKFLTVFPAGERPGVMTQEEKCNYLGQLKADQNCRMQALPPPREPNSTRELPVMPLYRNPMPAGTPVMLYDGSYR